MKNTNVWKKLAVSFLAILMVFVTGTNVKAEFISLQDIYRIYNPNSGEHFYTSDPDEAKKIESLGWQIEGIGWIDQTSDLSVYRLYNPNAGEHHYTMDQSERLMLINAGWRDEGFCWSSDVQERVPVYREYNPNAFANNHNYTTDKAEHDYLVSIGWRDEGIGWYAAKEGVPTTPGQQPKNLAIRGYETNGKGSLSNVKATLKDGIITLNYTYTDAYGYVFEHEHHYNADGGICMQYKGDVILTSRADDIFGNGVVAYVYVPVTEFSE